jgi:uncharacterized coiled-coil DUF342 family protein
MAEQPINVTEVILRQIQETLSGHTKRFDEIATRFDRLDKRFDEHHEGIITALGMSANSNVLHETVRREIEELPRRIQRLEEKV